MSIERNFLNYLFLSKSDLDSFLIWQDFFPTQRQAQTLRGGKNRNVHIETAIQTRGQSVTMMNHHTLSQVSSQIIYFGWNRRRFFHFLSFFYKMNDNLNFNATPLCWLLEFILLEAPRWAGEETNKCKCKSLLDKDNKCLTNLNNKTISSSVRLYPRQDHSYQWLILNITKFSVLDFPSFLKKWVSSQYLFIMSE